MLAAWLGALHSAAAGPVVLLQKLSEADVFNPSFKAKGHDPLPRARWQGAVQGGVGAQAETVFLDLQLCFNSSVHLAAIEFYVEDVVPLQASDFGWRVIHPIPSSSSSATQWFRLGDAMPTFSVDRPVEDQLPSPGAYRAVLEPPLRLGYADCLGWSSRGGSEPLPYDESSSAEVAWVRSSDGLPDAVELFVKRRLDPETSARKDPHIDWTGLERRTYSVRLIYREVQEEVRQLPEVVQQRAPVVEGGNPACWRGGFTFERCCKDADDSCWDSSFSFDRCCSLTSVKRYADFRFDPPAKSHYELLHLERDNKPRLGPVQDDEALLLYGLVRALRPRTIVEFGTSNGFSALNWMHAISDCPDARVFSYDILPYPAARALEDSDPRFMFHQKSQADFEPADVDGRPVDVAFFDAGHLIEYSLKAFERLRPSLAANAIVAVHDTGLHVRDFGSGAPPEEEGQPFSEASCALRAGGPARCYRFRDCQGEADAQGFCVGRAHRPSERQFVAEVLKRWPDFRPLHIHSRRVFRHGLTLLQRGDLLGPDNPDGTF